MRKLIITNCLDCPHHKIQADPDPSDWFNDDDVKIVCAKISRNIAVACRPSGLRVEAQIPSWCPLPEEPAPRPANARRIK